MTDPHYLSPSLYNKGEAFRRHLMWKKGNITEKGPEILEAFRQQILSDKPDFILVPGDLTNNGEKQSHLDLARYFASLEEEGVPVFIVPGNHDVNYPYPLQFFDDNSYPTEALTPGQFLTLYGDFGYEEALSRDLWSLSYAVNPVPGLRLIGLDSCLHGEDYGYVNGQTLFWLEDELKKGAALGESIVLFMHHSLLEHYRGQNKEKEMILKNSKELRTLLLRYGVQLVFTGHYHAQDIVAHNEEDRIIYDVETGALITWPFPFRKVTGNNNTITIESKTLTVPELNGNGRLMSYESIYNFSDMFLSRYDVNDHDRDEISRYVSEVLLRHYAGNETVGVTPEPPGALSLWGRLALLAGKNYYAGRLEDNAPDDLNIEIDTSTGSWTPLPYRSE